MRYLLDTNAVTALMRNDARVVSRLRAVPKNDVAIPQPVIAEVAYGIQRLPKSRLRQSLQERFDLVRAELGRAPWTDEISDQFGLVKAALERRGTRLEDVEAAVAAHALASDAVLVTTNLKQLARVAGLRVEDWAAPVGGRDAPRAKGVGERT